MKPWKALKYLLAFIFPVLAHVSFEAEGWLTFIPVSFAFVLIPVMELFLVPDATNLSGAEEELAAGDYVYDGILYMSVPVQIWTMYTYLERIAAGGYSNLEFVGMTLAMGLLCGIIGINVAHELGHRPTWYEQTMAKTLLLTSLYMHFFIEHNRGHHKRVGTPADPATARRGESIYFFYPRAILMGYFSAWNIQLYLLKKKQQPFLSLQNEMLMYALLQVTLLISIYEVYGGLAMLGFIGAAVMGMLLLETVNYIEHYGLTRKHAAHGGYERVERTHSWNSNHVLGRMMLFELSRHSDHHYKASKPYQLLRNLEHSPQLPTGYPGMMMLSLFPPAWFWVMHRKLKQLD